MATATAVKDKLELTATASPVALDLGELDPDEVLAVVTALRRKRAEQAEAAAELARRRETGYPRRLYNSKYLGESVLAQDGANRLNFYRGYLDVLSAEDEAHIRAVCPGRIFEADMPRERQCKRCSFITASSDCWEAHLDAHT